MIKKARHLKMVTLDKPNTTKHVPKDFKPKIKKIRLGLKVK